MGAPFKARVYNPGELATFEIAPPPSRQCSVQSHAHTRERASGSVTQQGGDAGARRTTSGYFSK